MSRIFFASVSAFAITVLAPTARAEGADGDLSSATVIVGLERVVSLFTYQSLSATPNGGSSSTQSGASIGLLAASPGGATDSFAVIPRLAIDGVVGGHFTLGGSAWIFTDVSASQSSGGTSQDLPKRTFGGVAPRVGYIAPITSSVAFWPRAGVEYYTIGKSSTTSSTGGSTVTITGGSLNQFAVALEGALVYSPFSHLGFDVELFGSIPVSGAESVDLGQGTTTNVNIAETVVGVTTGMLGYF